MRSEAEQPVDQLVRCADCVSMLPLQDEFFISIGVDFICRHGYAPHFTVQKYGRKFGCTSGCKKPL